MIVRLWHGVAATKARAYQEFLTRRGHSRLQIGRGQHQRLIGRGQHQRLHP
jgi:hypothetical protein